jgi:hypothetical protein
VVRGEFQAAHTKVAQVLKPRMTQTREAAIPMIERFCQASRATYYAENCRYNLSKMLRTVHDDTSLSTRTKFSEIWSQCSLIQVCAAELCWRAAMAMEKMQIKPQTQMIIWTPRTQTRFEYDAKQP